MPREKSSSVTHLVKTIAEEVYNSKYGSFEVRLMELEKASPAMLSNETVRGIEGCIATINHRLDKLEQEVEQEGTHATIGRLAARVKNLEQEKQDQKATHRQLPDCNRASLDWSNDEDKMLEDYIAHTISTLVALHRRTPWAIKCRIAKRNLL